MVKPIRRRGADPQVVINLWNAVAYIKQQKQIPNHQRITKYMEREHAIKKSECERQLSFAVEDDLLISYNSVKGTRNRISSPNERQTEKEKLEYEQEGFKLPDIEEEVERDNNDWYCFDCHQPGEVIACSECWRVYHPTCTEEPWTGNTFICSVCVEIKKQPRMKRKELNKLISYTVSRLKAKVKELHRFGRREDDHLKFEKLVFRHIDLETMENKARDRKYKYLEQFYADARTLLHNTFICFGDNSVMGTLAKLMIRDCKYDLDEIRQCKDCYYYSNAKPKDWFCQPCRPPHDLVYAKQKGFSYWPAKVIKITKEGYDVRFFGAGHTRAIVTENMIKPIEVTVKQLGTMKRTAGFNRACEELRRHQDLLEKSEHEPIDDEDEEVEQEAEEEYEPVIKHKKFRKKQREEEREVSSSNFSDKQAMTPEDHNLVTSTDNNLMSPQRTISTSDTGVQTSKKLSQQGKVKACQTDPSITNMDQQCTSCNCEEKHDTAMTDLRLQLEKQYNAEKRKAIKDVEERLRREFEQDRQSAMNHTTVSHQRDLEKVKQQTEDRVRRQIEETYMDEIKKLSSKNKAEVSTSKKKQWCYNCEEEAMYHCCWNTSYCSIKCQQEHWHREHKRMCRRKRN